MGIDQIIFEKNKCLHSWGKEADTPCLDERLRDFDQNFESWIIQFPPQYISIVLTLVSHMEYYSHQKVNKQLKELHQKLLEATSITEDDTIYTFIRSKGGYSNSSNDYWTEYKAINRINKRICIVDASKLQPEAIYAIKNIIVIDDFSGTGCSLITEIKNNLDLYKGKEIFFITIGIMEDAIQSLNNYCEKIDARITFITSFKQQKAFQRELFENNEDAKNTVHVISNDFGIPERWIMGFEDSQALVAFYNNTPNNTLGIIHCNTEKYKSLFPREHEHIPAWQILKRQKEERSNANYYNRVRGEQ